MEKNKIIAKVLLRLASLSQDHISFLKEIAKERDPKKLIDSLQQHLTAFPMEKPDIVKFLGKAKEIGVFKKHFTIPNMEKGWRSWVKEVGLLNQFRFES